MELKARLVHAEPGRRVVRVSARQGDRRLGSALGEAADAEQAEERATARLLARLGGSATPAPAPAPAPAPEPARAAAPPTRAPSHPAAPIPEPVPPPMPEPKEAETPAVEPAPDPDDWSEELARIDLQCQRLGWGREQEGVYLERAFGHPSRSRLTSWADLQAFLRALESFAPGLDPASAPVPLRRPDLLNQCDALLAQLAWGTGQARSFLEQRLGPSSRSQLSDEQLLQFNLLLETELLTGAAGTSAEPPAGGQPAAPA